VILKLLKNELAKVARTKLPYFAMLGILLLCVLVYIVTLRTHNESLNAWAYVSISMQLVFTDIGLILVVVFCAMLISEETGTGTVRTILACPVRRAEFIAAKALTGLIYTALLSITALSASTGMATLHYKFGAVSDSMGVIYTRREIFCAFVEAAVLSWIPLATVAMYGLFISSMIKRPGQAVAAAIGAIYLIDFTKHIIGVDEYVFTRYIGYSWRVFNQAAQGITYEWTSELWKMLVLCGIYFAVGFAGALVIFWRRDLNT
jgi:ABC-type transport system involved in multi-copper enzyme maturation permease subunit